MPVTLAHDISNKEVDLIYLLAGTVSAFLCGLVVVTYGFFPETRRHPSPFFLFRTLCDLVVSLAFLSSDVFGLAEKDDDVCAAVGVLTQFSLCASSGWFFAIAVDLLSAIRNPFTDHYFYSRYYHAFVWISSLLLSLPPAIYDRYGPSSFGFCWIRAMEDTSQINPWTWGCFYGPVFLCYLLSICILLYAQWVFRTGINSSVLVRDRVLGQGIVYVVAFGTFWTYTGAVWAMEFLAVRQNTTLAIVLALSVGGRGLVDFVVWGHNNKWFRQRFLGRGLPDDTYSDMTESTLQSELRADVLLCTTWGIIDGTSEYADLNISQLHAAHFSEKKQVSLRRLESKFMGASAMKDGAKPEVSRQPFTFVDYAPTVFAAIRETCGISHVNYCRSFHYDESLATPRTPLVGTPRSSRSFGSVSWTRGDGGLDPRLQTSMRLHLLERFTEGRSGSFFYLTSDEKYVVKTITRAESHMLREVLPSYYEYLKRNPQTLLARLYGSHAIRMSRGNAMTYFIVMENVMNHAAGVTLLEKYDIKGSWEDRTTRGMPANKEPTEETILLTDGETSQFVIQTGYVVPPTLKDGDIKKKVMLSQDHRLHLLGQLQRDCQFLCSQGLMDYSLLLGIGKGSSEAASIHVWPAAPVNLAIAETTYYLGLIDYLQPYDYKKKAERFFKAFIRGRDPRGISSMCPRDYADRLCAAVSGLVKGVKSAEF